MRHVVALDAFAEVHTRSDYDLLVAEMTATIKRFAWGVEDALLDPKVLKVPFQF